MMSVKSRVDRLEGAIKRQLDKEYNVKVLSDQELELAIELLKILPESPGEMTESDIVKYLSPEDCKELKRILVKANMWP
jgi:hypothetical protein